MLLTGEVPLYSGCSLGETLGRLANAAPFQDPPVSASTSGPPIKFAYLRTSAQLHDHFLWHTTLVRSGCSPLQS